MVLKATDEELFEIIFSKTSFQALNEAYGARL